MNESQVDRMLHVKTAGTLELLNQSVHYNRYEATPYQALDELFKHYHLTDNDRVVDFGCGKGRLSFYIHNRFQVPVIGIEMNARLHQDALGNRDSYMKYVKQTSSALYFENGLAQDYDVNLMDNRFYFFNPFSVQIFMKVIDNILQSVDQNWRSIDLILYYPTPEYIQFLENRTSFEFLEEVKVTGLYEHNENERFLIFRL